jgi:hypothetical protein
MTETLFCRDARPTAFNTISRFHDAKVFVYEAPFDIKNSITETASFVTETYALRDARPTTVNAIICTHVTH